MHFIGSLLLLLAVTAALVNAIPQPSSPPSFKERAYKRALERGIDPHGPRPNDFEHDNGQSVTFKENSDFAVWAAAQSAVAPELKKRAGTGIDVVTWTKPGCTGNGVHYYNVNYGQEYFDGRNLEINSMSQNNHAVPIHTQTIFLKFWNVGTTSCRDYAPNARYYLSNQDACVDTVPFTCFDIMDGI